MKKCSKCKLDLDESAFSKSKTLSSGLRSSCKACDAAYAAAHKRDPNILKSKSESSKRYYERNKAYVLKRNAEYYSRNYDEIRQKRKPKIAEWHRKRYERDGDVIRFRAKFSGRVFNLLNPGASAKASEAFRLKNPEYQKNWNNQFKKENPELVKLNNSVQSSRRRSRKLGLKDEPLTKDQWLSIMNESGWKCSHCGVTLRDDNCPHQRQVDHFFPLSKGFPMSIVNAIVLCKSCNCSKHDKSPFEFFSASAIAVAKERAAKHPAELEAYLSRLSPDNANLFRRFLSLAC